MRGDRLMRLAAVFCVWGLIAYCLPRCSHAADPRGDAQIENTAGESKIVIRTTNRLAGAIDSLTWNGKQFIDSADHGRQLQSACSFHDLRGRFVPETFNPTEAGSRFDRA